MTEYARTRKEARARGDKRYFTGKPCKHGHVVTRFVSDKACAECHLEARRAAYWKDPEAHRSKVEEWRRNNLDKKRAHSRKWSKKHPKVNRDGSKKWYYVNLDKARNDGRIRAQRRRALKRGNHPPMTDAEYREWVAEQELTCSYCGVDCADAYEIDHIVPLSRGGAHQAHNLCIACVPCNRRKATKTLDEFLDELMRDVA